jgi:hypothetical protein
VRSNSEDNREAGWLISGLDFRAPSRPDSETAKKNTTRRQHWRRQVITYSVTAYVAIMCAIFQRPASGSSSIKYICMYIRSCVHTLCRQYRHTHKNAACIDKYAPKCFAFLCSILRVFVWICMCMQCLRMEFTRYTNPQSHTQRELKEDV